jgi:peptidoglycan hydrolase-like protein with peptidoglycan-binding domain
MAHVRLRTLLLYDERVHGGRLRRAARGLLVAMMLIAGSPACTRFGLIGEAPTHTPTTTSTMPPTATYTPEPTPSPTPTLAPYVPAWPILRRGDGGQAEVFALQRLLRYHGRTIIADGRFGEQTLAAVQDLQLELGEPVDGLVGPVTWSALVEQATLREGDSGEAVKAAEYLLNKFRVPARIDGEFGPAEAAALKVFEAAVGLQPDGVIDALTWQALVAFKPSVEPSLSYP